MAEPLRHRQTKEADNRYVRPTATAPHLDSTLPVIVYLWKVIVWDKVLGWGTTDAIAGDVGVWAGTIVTTYVGGRSLEKIAKTVWSRP